MTTSTATNTAEISPAWLADRFAEIEKKDMRVTEVRIRSLRQLTECLIPHSIDVVRGKKYVWNARLVEDRRMKKGVVQFVYEKVVETAVVTRAYRRARCFACGK